MEVDNTDLLKILDTMRATRRFLRLRDEMNAELHLARETRYSPLTNEVDAQCDRLSEILSKEHSPDAANR